MAKNKTSFLLYNDQISTFEMLSNEEAGILIKHIYNYVNDKDPILEDRLLQVSFAQIKATLKRDLVKFEGKKEKNVESGNYSALKRYNKDLYLKVKADEMKLEEALKIAETRKEVKTTVEPILKTSKALKPKLDTTKREEQFLKFWDIYDRKDDKKKCLEKFLKLTDKQVEKIASTIIRYVEVNNVREFRKKPIKYLINENWNDEIEDQATKVPENNQGYKNASKENILSLFESDDLTILQNQWTTNKEQLKIVLEQFINVQSKKEGFNRESASAKYLHWINSLKHNPPKIVISQETRDKIEKDRLKKDEEWSKNFNT